MAAHTQDAELPGRNLQNRKVVRSPPARMDEHRLDNHGKGTYVHFLDVYESARLYTGGRVVMTVVPSGSAST